MEDDEFRCWPIATKFSLGLDVSFWGVAEVGWAAAFAASVAVESECDAVVVG